MTDDWHASGGRAARRAVPRAVLRPRHAASDVAALPTSASPDTAAAPFTSRHPASGILPGAGCRRFVRGSRAPMPRPLARPLTRAAVRGATRGALRAAALTVLHGAPVRCAVRGRMADRGDREYGRLRDRSPASRPRDYAALAIGAKRAMRAATLRDCGRRCVYCAVALSFDTVTLDHVYPRAHGGPNVAGNVVAACGPCNRLKADLLPSEFFIRHPWAGLNFMRYARTVHRALKRGARRAVSLAYAAPEDVGVRELRAA